jgi:hypothetical protein
MEKNREKLQAELEKHIKKIESEIKEIKALMPDCAKDDVDVSISDKLFIANGGYKTDYYFICYDDDFKWENSKKARTKLKKGIQEHLKIINVELKAMQNLFPDIDNRSISVLTDKDNWIYAYGMQSTNYHFTYHNDNKFEWLPKIERKSEVEVKE